MSKVNQIQQALRAIDAGEFQKLADAYLVAKGFGPISSVGSVPGANKVMVGTPDTFVVTPEGKYIFVEHTTQQSGLLDKIRGDLRKCFDELKTGVPISKLERVIFCITGRLTPAEENELAEVCREHGVALDVFDIDEIAFNLYDKYPGLARDFLGIEIDTGQIVPSDRFVALYQKSKLATRLDLTFHFREEEVRGVLDALEVENLVILTGRAGVGKSRMALEVCRRFKEVHPEYEVLCVFGRNVDLWADVQTWFRRPGHFLILVDDANRVSRFQYFVDLLQHQRDDQRIKVVATVRDYALGKIREASRPLGGGSELDLKPFTDEQIKELIKDEYGIANYHYLERIAEISRGNPRLAVMAAEVVRKEGSLTSIRDVSFLYDSYFSSIRQDLSSEGADPGSADLLRVAAIVSFFRAVDRTNEKMMSAIQEAFDLSQAVFWEAADRLHEMEILDMYEDEVVRVQDQVLGTYVFYLAVFKEKVLDFGALLVHFFPILRRRFIDSINPVLSAFHSKHVADVLRPYVERLWMALESSGDERRVLQLLEVFWFVNQTRTLLWIRQQIDKLEPEPVEITAETFKKSSDAVPSPSILYVLKPFAFVGVDQARIALDLLLRYIEKRPAEIPVLLQILIDDYGFRDNSHLRGFEVQRAVVDAVWGRVDGGDPFFSRVFLAVVNHYLGTRFEQVGMKDTHTVQITTFDIPATQDLVALREAIWQRLFALCEDQDLREDVVGVVRSYSRSFDRVTNSEVVKRDAAHVLPLLESVLRPDSYRDCALIHDYLDLLDKHGVQAPEGLRDRYCNETHALAEILLPGSNERRELHLSNEEYKRFARGRLERHTARYAFNDYIRFFDRCLDIRKASDAGHKGYQLRCGVVDALLLLADRAPDLYGQVLEYYLSLGDPFGLDGYRLVQKLAQQRGYDATVGLLRGMEFPARQRWLFYLHEGLSAGDVSKERLDHLLELYRETECMNLPRDFDYILKYLPLDSRAVAKVVLAVLDKAEEDPHVGYALEMLFNPYTDLAERLPALFAEDLDVLKRAYLLVERTRQHSDHEGQAFDRILDLDPGFITEYITWMYRNAEDGWLSRHDDHRDYSFIWVRPDYQDIMDRVLACTIHHEQGRAVINSYLATFFQTRGVSGETAGEVQAKQDAYLLQLIDDRSEDVELMEYVFGVISEFAPERRRQFVERFVRRNGIFEAFRRLPLEPSSWSWTGSAVPVLQRRVNYWESLLPILDTVDLLPHKQHVERYIQGLRAQIEREKKNDFISD